MSLSFKEIKEAIKQAGMLESPFSAEGCAIFTAPDKSFKYASILIYDTSPVEYLAFTWAGKVYTTPVGF